MRIENNETRVIKWERFEIIIEKKKIEGGGGGGREGENEKKKQMIFAITMSWVTKKRKIIAIAKPNKA